MENLLRVRREPAPPDVVGTIPEPLLRESRAIALNGGASLFLAGDDVRNMYLILSGEVRLVRIGRRGSEITLQRSRGGFVAEASLASKTYHCDAVASRPSELRAFPIATFRLALADDPTFCGQWQHLLANEVRKLRAQCERLNLKTAGERIIHYVEAEGTDGVVLLPMTKKAWATDLGLTHEALYRALKRLRDAGVLWTDGSYVGLNS